ncbi:TonB-dependent receptor [Novosphingobium sp. 1949]|uniref:TonB-dependent receptor n=1 Tax=Novosphingobium organovorum TaxID=2930092 RepID=A0ABT0BC28_9SPHN|nr:TonB-dependent receptor [Novosphingobium organovorum]MCJ2182543.1 TonB-dependent receptor [Novosphingobium organovorum]
MKSALAFGASMSVVAIAAAAPLEARAQDADEGADAPAIETNQIIVWGEKTRRTVRDTASSLVVDTAEDIRHSAGSFTVDDLLDSIPNIVSIEPGNDAPAVRGVDGTGPASGANAFLAGTRPRLNYQVDGRTLTFNEAVFGLSSLWDVDQVEVYRGPQSTLQGRNAIAGVISVHTASPTFDWHGAARAVVGNRDEVQLAGALGGPIIDGLAAFRVSADWQKSQSYIDFAAYDGVSNPGKSDLKSYRGKLLLTPAAGLRSTWTLSYQDGRQPQAEQVKQPYSAHVAQASAMPVFRSRTTTLLSDTSYELSDNVTLQAYLSGADFRVDRLSASGTGNLRIDGMEYVVQPFVRLRSNDDRVSGFVAAYVFRTHQDETIDLFGGGSWHDETATTAAFGEVTVAATSRLSVILGARYEEEKRDRVGSAGVFSTDFHETYREFLPKASLSFQVSDDVTVGASAGRAYNAGGAGITFASPYVEYTYDPEYVWSFEGFLRTNLASNVSLNANVFYSLYTNMQLPFYLSSLSTIIANAQKASTYGAELALDWRWGEKNRIYASAGALRTRIDEYSQQDLVGNDLPRAPAFSAAAGFVLSPDGHFELSGDVRYSDAYYSDILNTARARVDPYAVVNGQVAYDFGKARVFLAVRNLLNSGPPILYYTGTTASADYATLLQPRKISAGVEVRF